MKEQARSMSIDPRKESYSLKLVTALMGGISWRC
jgi:hypothetical protein